MRTKLLILLLVALAFPGGSAIAQPASQEVRPIVRTAVDSVRRIAVRYQQGREQQFERQTKTVKIGSDGELSLANIAGDIVVTRGGGSETTIEIVKTARARTAEEARELLGLVQVSVAERGGRTEIRTVYPRGDELRRENRRNINVSVAYTVAAPEGTRLTIGTISGNVTVSDIKGDLTLNSTSGNIKVSHAGRIGSAKTVSGDVEITDTQVDGTLEAASISGSVILRRVRARRLDAGSISGGIVIADIECERVDAHSFSGNVELTGRLVKHGRYVLKSHSGDVWVGVVGPTGFELDANSFSGSVRSELPLSLSGGPDGGRGRRSRALRGVSGDGSAVLDVTTFSGSVVIAKR